MDRNRLLTNSLNQNIQGEKEDVNVIEGMSNKEQWIEARIPVRGVCGTKQGVMYPVNMDKNANTN